MELRTRIGVFRAESYVRRADRRRRRRLQAELATYTTQADVNDLCAVLDTYPDSQTQEIRDILWQQRFSRALTAGGLR